MELSRSSGNTVPRPPGSTLTRQRCRLRPLRSGQQGPDLPISDRFLTFTHAHRKDTIDYVPSGAAFEALAADPSVEAAQHHFQAALEDAYGMKVDPMVSAIP